MWLFEGRGKRNKILKASHLLPTLPLKYLSLGIMVEEHGISVSGSSLSKHSGICNDCCLCSGKLEGNRNPEWQNLDQHMQTHPSAFKGKVYLAFGRAKESYRDTVQDVQRQLGRRCIL